MRVRLTQIDGKLPNLALMKLAHWHKAQGDTVLTTRDLEPGADEENSYDRVYGSCIFDFSEERLDRFKKAWPEAIIGGTGVIASPTVESIIGDYEHYDYSGFPDFDASIGFTQRGCRLKCKFCVVPEKEGKNVSLNTIEQIWRGDPYPRHLHLLDNDFFGQPEWADRVREIIDGKFKVCLNQGINVRLITEESAAACASIKYYDDRFHERRLYTAWDNLKDEKVFFRGVGLLNRAGVPPRHLMAYMLVGYDPLETWGRVWHRFHRMIELGIKPYPMVYNKKSRPDLGAFQRWVVTKLYTWLPWNEFKYGSRTEASTVAYLMDGGFRKPGQGRLRNSWTITFPRLAA